MYLSPISYQTNMSMNFHGGKKYAVSSVVKAAKAKTEALTKARPEIAGIKTNTETEIAEAKTAMWDADEKIYELKKMAVARLIKIARNANAKINELKKIAEANPAAKAGIYERIEKINTGHEKVKNAIILETNQKVADIINKIK